MSHMIEISDSQDGLLPTLLKELGSEGLKLNWALLYLYATGDLGENKSIIDFENDIEKSPHGFCLSWQELNQLANKLDQVFDILIVGAISTDMIRKYKEDKDLYLNSYIVFELIDGSCWEVYSEDTSFIEKLAARFIDVKLSK